MRLAKNGRNGINSNSRPTHSAGKQTMERAKRGKRHDKMASSSQAKARVLHRRLGYALVLATLVYALCFTGPTWQQQQHTTRAPSPSSTSIITGEELQRLAEVTLEQSQSETQQLAQRLSELLTTCDTSDDNNKNNNSNNDKDDTFEDYVTTYGADDLRTRLSHKFPYSRHAPIPKVVWQIWKEPLHEVKNNEIRNYLQSWAQQSSDGYKHRVITDDLLEAVVQELYGDFPEIMDTYRMLPMDILRFDFLRYLVLYARGGVYADADTLSMKPLKEWADEPEELSDLISTPTADHVGFVVGIEGDYDRADWRFKTSRRVQMCQWTFKSKAGHPILRELIYKITRTTLQNYNERLNHVKIGKEYHTLHSIYTVLEWTGPAAFTDVIFTHFNKIFPFAKSVGLHTELPSTIQNVQFEDYHKPKNSITSKKHVGWTNFTRLMQPAMYDDVLVLPMASFNGFTDDAEFKMSEELIYLKHEFHGSWKNL